MGFFDRLGTLVRADAHGLVDSLSDDRLLLRQHVREAAEALAAKEARLDALKAEQKDLGSLAERLEAEAATLEKDTDLALAEDREDLARFTLQKMLGLRRRIARIGERRQQLGDESRELEGGLEEQRLALDELRARARTFLEQRRLDPLGEDGDPLGDGFGAAVADEEVELELLRRRVALTDGAEP
jgi:phage shock protein A